MRRVLYALLFAAIGLSGCSYDELAGKLIPEEESQYAEAFLEDVLNKNLEQVWSELDPELASQVSDQKIIEVSDYFRSGELLSVEIIGSHTTRSGSGWQGNFTFEYEFSEGWALANAVVKRSGERLSIIGFSVYQTEASQRELNSFTAIDVSPWHILTLILTVLMPAFMIYTCYVVYKTPIPVKKRRWYFISFVGFFSFSFNWTTGVLTYQLLTLQLLGFGIAAAGPHAPWMLEFTLPVGAAAFWAMRKKLMQPETVVPTNEDVE